jgi:hypothetical protein
MGGGDLLVRFRKSRAPGHSRARFRRPLLQTPPVRAFWSLTKYNDQQLFAANPINRWVRHR